MKFKITIQDKKYLVQVVDAKTALAAIADVTQGSMTDLGKALKRRWNIGGSHGSEDGTRGVYHPRKYHQSTQITERINSVIDDLANNGFDGDYDRLWATADALVNGYADTLNRIENLGERRQLQRKLQEYRRYKKQINENLKNEFDYFYKKYEAKQKEQSSEHEKTYHSAKTKPQSQTRGLGPRTIHKLESMGYTEEQYKNWTLEEARRHYKENK